MWIYLSLLPLPLLPNVDQFNTRFDTLLPVTLSFWAYRLISLSSTDILLIDCCLWVMFGNECQYEEFIFYELPKFDIWIPYLHIKTVTIRPTTLLSNFLHCFYSGSIYLPKKTPWSRVLRENLTRPKLLKKFHAFYGTRRFITVYTRARRLSLSWARSTQSAPPHPTSQRSILILSSHLKDINS
jgi:hypothetical protein